MFRCSYTIIRERINSYLLKLQLLNSPLKYIGVYVCIYVSVCVYNCNFSKHELMRSLMMV
jgi:hypothetical protein